MKIYLSGNFFDLMKQPLRKMKTTFLIVIMFASSLFATNAKSQVAKVNISLRNVSVLKVLQSIESQTDYLFVYNKDEVNLNRSVNVDASNRTVDDVLSDVFTNTDVAYKKLGTSIILMKNPEMQSQGEVTVTGVITDSSGEPLPGVTVVVKGTTVGITTDLDGRYSLKVPSASSSLVFSFVGMVSQEIVVGTQRTINLTMEADAIGLEEVVAIGYGTQKKATLTGAASSVKTADLDEISTPALSNTLAGRASGITVINNSGFAGATSSIKIRGSLTDPLFVIDNVVKDKSAFDALDPNEVEEISFLKDAAAASIYGMKAADGVVLVKTKGGKLGKRAEFTYKGSYSFQETTYNTNDYTALDEVIFRNDYEKTYGREPYYTDEEVAYIRDNNINYNLYDAIWKNPTQQQHSISASGGSDKTSYYFMGSFHKSDGSYQNTNYQRFNFRSNVTSQLTERLKLNVNVSGNQREINRFFWPYDYDNGEGFTVGDFYRATFNVSRIFPWYVAPDGTPLKKRTEDAIPTVGSNWGFHPGENIFSTGNRNLIYRTANVVARLDWDLSSITQGLSTSFMGNYTADDKIQKDLRLHQTYYKPALDPDIRTKIDESVPVDQWQEKVHNLSQSYENIYQRSGLSHNYQLNWFLDYQRTFGKHEVTAMTVYEQRGYYGYDMNGTAYKLLSRDVDQIFATSSDSEDRTFTGWEGNNAFVSWIGRFGYNYAEKYIAEFSFRYDGNYRFPKSTRWGLFPSVSAAWRLTEENFLKDISWLSNLKLRGSFGTSGNDIYGSNSISAFMYQNNYIPANGFVFGNSVSNGIRPGAIPNPDITWAKTRSWNAGVDFGFWGGKLTGEIDYFYRFNYDILGSRIRTIPTTWGGSAPAENYIETDIRGIDFSLQYHNNIGEFKYDIGFNMGYAKDKVLTIDETEGLQEWRSQIGRPKDRVFGYISKGMIRDQATLDALPEGFTQFGREPMLGTLLFEDIRGANYSEGPDGKIDSNDATFLSDNGIPRINYGFTFNGEWKGITVNALFQGVGAYDRMIRTRNGDGVFQVGDRPYFGLWKDHWSEDNQDAKYPRPMGWMKPEAGGGGSTFWMKNGAYLRLKNLNVAYDLPKQWLQPIGVKRLQFFVNGTNLLTFSEVKEIMDPEQETLDSYPVMKTYSAGLTLTF